METVSLARERPEIEMVFGPISESTDQRLRSIFGQVDEELLALSVHLGQDPNGWAGGLCLKKFGHSATIVGHTGECLSGSQCVQFYLELSPSSVADSDPESRGWNVEADIEADCQHAQDHGGLETVWDRGHRHLSTPEEAALELLEAARQLNELGRQHPLDHWLAMASD